MNSLPMFRHPAFRVVAVVWLFLASGLAVMNSIALSRLRAEMDPQRAEVTALQVKLVALKHQLSDLAHQPTPVTEARFLENQRATNERVAQVEEVLSHTARRQELADWQGRLTALEAQLTKLRPSKVTQRRPPRVIPHVAASESPEPEIPFRALGIEMRGGEPFLALAPLGASSLADVRVLRTGERWAGWELTKLESQAADFTSIDGHTRRVELPAQVRS